MNVAIVDQSLVDAHLDRIHRFANSVNAFKERLNEMLSAHASENAEQSEPVSAYTEPTAYDADVLNSNMVSTESHASPLQPTVTADDIDIDAILNGIDIDGELGL